MEDAEIRDKYAKALPTGLSYTMVNVCMFGLTCYQVLKYYIRKRDDRASVKLLYALLWFAEAINLITAPINYDRLVKTLDKPDPFSSIRGSLVMMVVAQFLGAMILKGIIVHETWKLGNRSWLFLAVLIILFGGSRLIARQLPDILLSATLSFLLAHQRKNRSRLERVNSISSAFTYVVSIGALPPICVALSIIVDTSARGTQLALLCNHYVQRIYLNTVLAALNANPSDERAHAL